MLGGGKISKETNQGFTLVEMMVVVTIFIIITAISLASLPRFRDKMRLDLIAQEVALLVRQSQAFGVSTRAFGPTLSFPSYGVYFDMDIPTRVILFADKDGDGAYNEGDGCSHVGSGTTECLDLFSLPNPVVLKEIEAMVGSDSTSVNSVSVVFVRPYPEAYFNSNPTLPPGSSESYYKVTLGTIDGASNMFVYIWKTGHIYAE